MKKKIYFIFINIFISLLFFCINSIAEETLIGQMEFDEPKFVALVQDKESMDTYVYKKKEVISSPGEDMLFKILGIRKNFIVGKDKNNNVVSLVKGEFFPFSKKIVFRKGIKAKKIKFSYVFSDYNDPEFKFSRVDGDIIYLVRHYKFNSGKNELDYELFNGIEIKKISDNELIFDRESIEPVMIVAESIIKRLMKKNKNDNKKEDGKETLNLNLSNSMAEIILGSSGILVKRFFLDRIPDRIDLREGDFIKRINKKPINNLRDVYNVVKEVKDTRNIVTLEVDLIRDYKIVKKYFKIQ